MCNASLSFLVFSLFKHGNDTSPRRRTGVVILTLFSLYTCNKILKSLCLCGFFLSFIVLNIKSEIMLNPLTLTWKLTVFPRGEQGYFLRISLMSSLTEDSWIFLPSFFILLWYVVLVEAYEENLSSWRHVVGKGRIVFMDINITLIVDILLWYYTRLDQVTVS